MGLLTKPSTETGRYRGWCSKPPSERAPHSAVASDGACGQSPYPDRGPVPCGVGLGRQRDAEGSCLRSGHLHLPLGAILAKNFIAKPQKSACSRVGSPPPRWQMAAESRSPWQPWKPCQNYLSLSPCRITRMSRSPTLPAAEGSTLLNPDFWQSWFWHPSGFGILEDYEPPANLKHPLIFPALE